MHFRLLKNTVLFSIIIGIVSILHSCGPKTSADKNVDVTEAITKLEEDSLQASATHRTKSASESEALVDTANSLSKIIVGANRLQEYLPLLQGKRIGIVANQTSVIFTPPKAGQPNNYVHLVDSLVSLGLNIKKVLAPEHGFRGNADAGEFIKDGLDTKTGVPLISIYGKNKKPSTAQLADIDIMVFDIQDVGARFYTYISTLHYLMEACAEQNIPLVILDRPNPNGHYIDGPILQMQHTAFVGMHPIPVVHGMTIGEYAKMINGQGWLNDQITCDIAVIPIKNYTRHTAYNLPIKPSPNLPNDKSINLYPSLCFFEGTNVSAGRGTEQQFQIFGSPFLDPQYFKYEFTPQPNVGAKNPRHKGELCYGLDLTEAKTLKRINLDWLIEAYNGTADKSKFFNSYFTTLAGTTELQKQIEQGYTQKKIRATWVKGLEDFKRMSGSYLIYESGLE
jgi:uncharacterized protein YbbC (DUF1343 family)